MIRILRSQPAPAVLTASTRRSEHEAAYDAAPGAYESGKQTFPFDRAVYANSTVKDALIEMQHEKCAFCESKPLATSSGDVEHFRPKAAVCSSSSGSLERPGYYWLAYDWENLLFACEQCNRRSKKNAFPLEAPRPLPRTHHTGIAGERPVFVDPASEDPAVHIGFRKHMPFRLTARGEATIDGLALRRRALADAREERLAKLFDTFRIAEDPLFDLPKDVRIKATTDLATALSDEAEYAAMNRAAVVAWRARLARGETLDEP